VHIIVFVAAGGSPDISGRLVGQSRSERLGQPFVIDNRLGVALLQKTTTWAKLLRDANICPAE
jgi:hypothetical protein